jgi:hypothetical protein
MRHLFTIVFMLIAMSAHCQSDNAKLLENDGTNTTTSSETKMEAKLGMFQQLHADFGKSKITSVKVSGNKVVMILNTDTGMKGIVSLEVEASSPWLIDKMGIEVESEN